MSDKETQARVVKRMNETKPKMIIGSPPCTLFSRLQQLNIHVQGPLWKEKFDLERVKATEHIKFCLRLFNLQRNRGDYFLFEHPGSADSWELPEMREFRGLEGVMTSVVDQCMYGLVTHGAVKGELLPAKKPTRFMSNSWYVLEELSHRCDKSHTHQPLMGGRAAKAAEYPDDLCAAMCRGLANQKRYDKSGRVCTGVIGAAALQSFVGIADNVLCRDNCLVKPSERVIPPDDRMLDPSRCRGKRNDSFPDGFPSHWQDNKHEPDGTAREFLVTSKDVPEEKSGYFRVGVNDGASALKAEMNVLTTKYDGSLESWDDVTGASLVAKLVQQARAIEMTFFAKMGVFAERLPRHVVKARGGKIIKGRWVDTNKGDSTVPDYRSRFVGKEFNVGVDPALYAATPPLEALKLLLGHASSKRGGNVHLMLSDVKRAYFHAKAERERYVALPEED